MPDPLSIKAIELIESFARDLSAQIAAHGSGAYAAGARDALAAVVTHAEHHRAFLERTGQERLN